MTETALAASVRGLRLDDAVRELDPAASVVELRTEERRGTDVIVTVNADVLFAFDSDELTDAARREGARIAERIGTGTVLVDGYTDSLGTPAYNLILSQRRANAVAELLRPMVAAGVRVSATGHGAADPVARNTRPDGSDDPAGRALNRRVTITYSTT